MNGAGRRGRACGFAFTRWKVNYTSTKSPFFAFLSSRGVIILVEELGGQFGTVLLLLRGFLWALSVHSRFVGFGCRVFSGFLLGFLGFFTALSRL